MKRIVLGALALSACQPRSEIIIGFATDLKATDQFDNITLNVTRVSSALPEGGDGTQFAVSGTPDVPYNLPASFGLFSEDQDVLIDVTVTGSKNNQVVTSQRAVLSIISGETLFYRMGLTGSCVGKADCLATETCVEGQCRDVVVNPHQLPTFTDTSDTQLACDSGTAYISTDTGQPMPFDPNAAPCGAGLCSQGTCLNPLPAPDGSTRTVTGASFTNFIQPNTVSAKPDDLSGLDVSALVADSTGTFSTFPGTGTTDGSFVVPNVPQGEYYLKIGTNYFVTAGDSFDLSSDTLGRPNKVVADPNQTTSIVMNLAGLDPWVSTDHFEAYSADVDTWWFATEFCAPIANGLSTLANYTLTNKDGCAFTSTPGSSGTFLNQNDDFAIAQLTSQQTSTGLAYTAATRFVVPSRFTQVDGGSTTVTDTFTAPALSSSLRMTFKTTLWDAAVGFDGTHAKLVNPLAQAFPGGISINVLGTPNSTVYGEVGNTADFLSFSISNGTPDVDTSEISYATPLATGESWGVLADVRSSFHVPTALPGTTCPANKSCDLRAFMSMAAPVTAFSGPVGPKLGPVLRPTIDSGNGTADLFASQTATTLTPTIAWALPSVGTPTAFVVSVFELSVSTSAPGTTAARIVATITTSDSSVIIPPAILQSGQTYAFTIAASTVATPAVPNRKGLGSVSAIVSALVTVQAQGGSGSGGTVIIDAGVADAPP